MIDIKDDDGTTDEHTIGGAALLDRMVRQRDERIAELVREVAELRETVDAQAKRIERLAGLGGGS